MTIPTFAWPRPLLHDYTPIFGIAVCALFCDWLSINNFPKKVACQYNIIYNHRIFILYYNAFQKIWGGISPPSPPPPPTLIYTLGMPFKSDIILCHTQLPSYPGFSSPCPQWYLFEFTEFWAVEQVDIHCTRMDKASLSNQTMESGTAIATLLLPQNCFCKYKSFFFGQKKAQLYPTDQLVL